MDLVLVMMLAYIFTGQSKSKFTTPKCSKECPAGSYAVDVCNTSVRTYRCNICSKSTFTEINNSVSECFRCNRCHNNAEEIKPCTTSSDVECRCKDGYYVDPGDNMRCLECKCNEPVAHPGYTTCRECEKCLKAATTSASRATSGTTTSNNKSVILTSWVLLVTVPVTLLLFLGLLLLLARSPTRYPDSCLCWGVKENPEPPLEDPDFNGNPVWNADPSSLPDRHPNTLTLNILENTPMMTLSCSPSGPEHPVHISPLDCEHEAKGKHEKSDRWPAIALYAIIKEVPLRRWKEFMRLLSLTDQQLERVELEAGLGLGSMERQYQMLRLWSQSSSATLNDVFSALRYMDLSGCAQQLKETLEKQPFAGLI
ncbi:tumor necrosis factor receptor superfamily member 1A [Spinachia spinachia]